MRPYAAHAAPPVSLRPSPSSSLGRLARLPVAALLAVLAVGLVGFAMPTEVDAASVSRIPACGVALRTRASTAATRKASINVSQRVTVVATVSGGRWRQACDGRGVTGSKWFRISAIDGRSVSSLYGVRYVYAPKGLFESTAPPTVVCDARFPDAPSTTTDQSGAIARFLRAHEGKRVCFRPGATYRVDARLELDFWTGTIFGRGATFRRYKASTSQSYHIRIVQGRNIVIDGLNVRGPATLSDIQNRVFGSGDREDQSALSVETTNGFTLRNATLSYLWGDGVSLRPRNASGVDGPTRNALIQNVDVIVSGRNGFGLISVDGLVIRRSRVYQASLHGIVGEPNRTSDVLANIAIYGNDVRGFDAGHTPSGPGYAIAITPGNGAVQPVNILIRNNRMDRARVRVDGYSSSRPARNVTVTGNRPATKGTAWFTHVRGLIFKDNGLMGISKSDVS